MGKVRRILKEVNKNNLLEFLSSNFKVNDEFLEIKNEANNIIYKNIELNSILVNAVGEEETCYLDKLVSLKAFLLSKQQGMDINNLIYNINEVMKISDTINISQGKVKLDNSLYIFLEKVSIDIDTKAGILSDSKRSVKVEIISNKIEFNSIEEII